MKRFRFLMILLAAALIAAACGTKDKQPAQEQDMDIIPLPISVDLTVPATAEIGQEVELIAKVTQGEEVVTDASEVEFEVIEETSGEKQMLPAELKDEQYTAVITIEHPGSYSVTSHVTARDMHTMPTKVIEVAGEDGEVAATPQTDTTEHSHHHGAAIEFENGQVVAGEETKLSTIVTMNEAPLTEANVRFEIWKDGSERHDWVDTKEAENGQYDADYTFKEKGKYFVQVHVEKDPDIHDHVTKEYTVK